MNSNSTILKSDNIFDTVASFPHYKDAVHALEDLHGKNIPKKALTIIPDYSMSLAESKLKWIYYAQIVLFAIVFGGLLSYALHQFNFLNTEVALSQLVVLNLSLSIILSALWCIMLEFRRSVAAKSSGEGEMLGIRRFTVAVNRRHADKARSILAHQTLAIV